MKADWKAMDQHLHEGVNDVLQTPLPPAEKYLHLQKYKAKLIRHHAEYKRQIFKDVADKDRDLAEEPILFDSLRQRGRQAGRDVLLLTDERGTTHENPGTIRDIFVQHVRDKYQHIHADAHAMHTLLRTVTPTETSTLPDILDRYISMDELKWAVMRVLNAVRQA
jgi:hypothetical protein